MPQKSLFRIIAEPVGIALVLAFAVRSCVGIYSVPSASMSPVLQPGDRILATRVGGQHVERGDVIVFRNPGPDDHFSVKRVIGMPGDLVESRDGNLFISGRPLPDAYGRHPAVADIQPQLIPGGHLFVLGDNRMESWDSRHWGPLPAGHVVARARIILWQGRAGGRIFKWIR